LSLLEEQVVPLHEGLIGLSLEEISEGKWGWCKFPIGHKDDRFAGGRIWIRVKVYAIEPIRIERDVMVYNNQKGCKEHTPVEVNYELAAGGYQRVGEDYPFPVTLGSKNITYETVECTAAGNTPLVTPTSGYTLKIHWYSISNKHAIVADIGMRFGANGTIKHKYGLAPSGGIIAANILDSCWKGAEDEVLYAYLTAAYANGVYFTIGYTQVKA
jgi:hypothetical protein